MRNNKNYLGQTRKRNRTFLFEEKIQHLNALNIASVCSMATLLQHKKA